LAVPLNVDGCTIDLPSLSAGRKAQPRLGVLDGAGCASAQVLVPPGLPPAAVGLELTHAYVLFLPTLDFASNAVTLTLTP
jgi:hypothetical protein